MSRMFSSSSTEPSAAPVPDGRPGSRTLPRRNTVRDRIAKTQQPRDDLRVNRGRDLGFARRADDGFGPGEDIADRAAGPGKLARGLARDLAGLGWQIRPAHTRYVAAPELEAGGYWAFSIHLRDELPMPKARPVKPAAKGESP